MKRTTAFCLVTIYHETRAKFPGLDHLNVMAHTALRANKILGCNFETAHVARALEMHEQKLALETI